MEKGRGARAAYCVLWFVRVYMLMGGGLVEVGGGRKRTHRDEVGVLRDDAVPVALPHQVGHLSSF